MLFSKTYSKLWQSEHEDNESRTPKFDDDLLPEGSHVRSRQCAYILLVCLVALTCALFGYVAHPNTKPSCSTPSTVPSTTPTELHCGNSSTEARSLGCVFDLLTNNWMPKYCADPTTDAEYRAWVLDPSRHLGTWAFYHDDKAERQVTSEEVLSDLVGSHIYTTTENHLAHCVFLARRMHRLVTGEIAAVAHNTFGHTLHCTSALLKTMGMGAQAVKPEIGSTFDVGIVSCLVNGHIH
ncbi:hypothetical protein CONLIGDRAFT_683554 [Coniochaeta ligniaria NRRL 30616]|uniref:Uncharacterized protein n=1 Tax=Coniochaeta ligniaria NRRL 30616 TaxID=1408157 RepID=A0A1J7IGS1_9PEZI|nr:hypothetical protein CONLIGDRAFT_683554 [Coniochaeta ligniaria NRRL 30616]